MVKVLKQFKYFPLIVGVIIFLIILINFHDITAQDIVDYTPDNYLLAFLMMMGIYAIKSLSIFIPLPVLYASSTLIFTSKWAVLVNFLGLIVCMTLPYLVGRYGASRLVQVLFNKYPKTKKINDIKMDNEFIFTFIVKLMGFIPNDISSLLLGSLSVSYLKYISASVLVRMPLMLITTIAGLNLFNGEDINLIMIGILVFISAIVLYFVYRKYRGKFN